MQDQNKNLILATALSFFVILVWFMLFPPPETPTTPTDPEKTTATQTEVDTASSPASATNGDDAKQPEIDEASTAPRVAIDTPSLKGSISLKGGRIDDLALENYRQAVDPDSDIVTLLAPVSSANPYYALFGWAPGTGLTPADVPGANTVWALAEGETLAPGHPITLTWENDSGLRFRREIAVDEKFMFTVNQSVENTGDGTVSLAAYGILARHSEPDNLKKFFILHEGGIRMADGQLSEIDYDDFVPASQHKEIPVTENGWVGFTDHFWMATLIPDSNGATKFSTFRDTARDIYQNTVKQGTESLAPGQTINSQMRLFAGAKEWATIRGYQNDSGVDRFLDSIDWGWFFFLTKPIFWLLHNINQIIGNMGWSIIALTFILKALLLPLAYKSYVSMARMKELQPEMEKIKERADGDKQQMQKDIMQLYKKEKVNPASGCLPILLQIPIFFSLYKVIFVTLELRHAAWLGWIRDLSAPDPSSILNLFGLLSFTPPEQGSILAIISLGVLPILLGISMWLQQKLNPTPTDPTQKMIFAWMPWVFMFMLGNFASGLVLYWITNNTITFLQQYAIMRSQGYKPDVFGNIKQSFQRSPKPEEKPKSGNKPKSGGK